MAEAAGLPFVHIPVTPATKPRAEAELLALVDDLNADLVVLARYMQVLSDNTRRYRAARSTSTTHFCLASRAPSPTTRPTIAA
jgi:formyltetrahydrofolate deformylase